ncbi:MAG: SAM-dependent methyltransferase [Campylobacterales bacterium]
MRVCDYIQAWLYGADGYYANFREIGKEGDFITSVSVTPLFGATLGAYLVSLIDDGKLSANAAVVEIGAHQGYLMADMIQMIYTLRPELLSTLSFVIIERFEALREVQRRYLEESFGDTIRVTFAADFSELSGGEAYIVANEIFDAFPAALINGELEAWVEEGRIVWRPADEALRDLAGRYGIQKGEVALGYESFAASMAKAFPQAIFLSFDYGERYPRQEMTMRLFVRHQLYRFDEVDLREYFGTCDVTYSVNFDHLIRAFEAEGWKLVRYGLQGHELIKMGLSSLLQTLEERLPYDLYLREVNKAKMLIHPDYFGVKFKVVEFIR